MGLLAVASHEQKPVVFVDLCQIHFSLNYSFQVIEIDQLFTLVVCCYNFSFKEETFN